MTSLGGPSGSDNPNVENTVPASQTTTGGNDIRREDRAGEQEDVSGPCDEAEHANDPRCTGAAPQAGEDANDDANDDHSANRGPGNGGGEDNSGHQGNSGPGGEDDD
jgi:hypothetical protein